APRGVDTGRTLEQIAAAADHIWHSDRDGGKKVAARKPPAALRPTPARRGRGHAPVSVADVPGIRRAELPKFVPPQLATLVSQAPSGEAWLHEMKYDGYRLLAWGNGKTGPVRYSDHVAGDGADFFTHACRLGLEGTVAKRRDAPYRGTRGTDWLKIKCVKRQEVVIGGYTDPEGSRVGIGA